MSIVIEDLFPEVCSLFGDTGNMRYLVKSLPEAEYIRTPLNGRPAFADRDVNMIYMGPMTESSQLEVMKRLLPHKERIRELIENGTVFLMTGNAHEIFGKYIDDSETGRTECMGILDFTVRRNMMKRKSGLVLGTYEDIDVVGFHARFTEIFPEGETQTFLEVEKGEGMNKKCRTEGIVKNNFIGTYLLGPVLVLNPLLTKKIIKRISGKDLSPAFEEEAMKAYRARLEDFRDKKVGIH
ncbi:MAG: hypothetical protein ACI4I9_01555 [Porcipelethomonas sp.]